MAQDAEIIELDNSPLNDNEDDFEGENNFEIGDFQNEEDIENDVEAKEEDDEDNIPDSSQVIMGDEEEDEEDEEDDDCIITDDDNSQSTSFLKQVKNGSQYQHKTSSVESGENDSLGAIQKDKVSASDSASHQNGQNELNEQNDTNDSGATKDSTKAPIDHGPDLADEETGFNIFLKPHVKVGKCIAINKKTWNDIEIDASDSILDCPSQVVPLMIKRPDTFPPKLVDVGETEDTKSENNPPSVPVTQNPKSMLTIADFFSSSAGNFLITLGLSRVKQWYHKDIINQTRKQIHKDGELDDLVEELKSQQEMFNECRHANSAFIFSMDKCEFCEFKTESRLVLQGHLSFPHLTSRREYKCNYCQFATRDSKQIVIHTQALHDKHCRIEMPPQLYECPVCPYESGVKSKAATHITKCLKFFNPERLLVLQDETDYPTITPKPITQEDIKIYEATLQALRFAALNPQSKVPFIPGLPSGLQQQMLAMQQQKLGFKTYGSKGFKNVNLSSTQRGRPITNPYGAKNVAPQLYQMLATASGHTQLIPLQKNVNQAQFKNKTFAGATMLAGKNSMASAKPNILGKSPMGKGSEQNAGGKSGTFVICEICDGYIKDLEQLRTHMQWIHKVAFCKSNLILFID